MAITFELELPAGDDRPGLTRADLPRHDPVREALQAAAEAASLACTRAGAEPPWLAEVRDLPGWRSGFAAAHLPPPR